MIQAAKKNNSDMSKELTGIIKAELIGLKAVVINSKNVADIGISGDIINETKNTLSIGQKMIFKKNVRLKINGIEVDGEKLLARPQDRIKIRV